ncbi:MAG: hypothetical protein H0V12_03450 [Chloroflexi bacterium]|nr:hypothetical protein [Chloroflexota bacterium]
MTGPDVPDDPAPEEGAATAQRGTPVPVDLSGDPRARSTIALFLAGPVIWSAHFLVVYFVVEAGCTGEGPGLAVFNPPVPTVVTLVATAVAAVACLLAAAWAYRRWRHDRRPSTDADRAPVLTGGSLAFAGYVLSLLGFVTVLFVGLPALVLPAC